MTVRYLLVVGLAMASPVAIACSGSVPGLLYTNVVRLDGPNIPGLKWIRVYNILDYEGSQRVLVSVVRQGRRLPVAKWENGLECAFDEAGRERCEPDRRLAGVSLERYFPRWTDAADRKDSLRKLHLPLLVETGGREIAMRLLSRPVRTTRELRQERYEKIANSVCEELTSAP
jgi:hypothetical protein